MNRQKSQKGVITLIISIIILVLSTLVVFYISKSILLEQKITNNDIRGKQAFEAAEAGILAALDYMSNGPDRGLDDDLDTSDVDGLIDPVFDTTGTGMGDSDTIAIGTGSVTVTAVNPILGNFQAATITSTGFSDDRSAQRTITLNTTVTSPLPTNPVTPVVTRQGLVISGSATVHNPEGFSTIWSGDSVDLGSNNSTSTEVPDISAADYPVCMETSMTCGSPSNRSLVTASNRLTASLDIIENDSTLSDLSGPAFFESIFGVTAGTLKTSLGPSGTNETYTPAEFLALEEYEMTHNTMWIDNSAPLVFSGVTSGCASRVTGNNVCSALETQPSVIIVEGNAAFSGGNQFYGLLYVRGDVVLSGNTTIFGAMIVEGVVSSAASASLDVWYSSDVLRKLADGNPGAAAGGWRDFEHP